MPIDRSAIDEQLREIGEGERWWEHREFRALTHILHGDERIRGLTRGKLLGARRPRIMPAATWLFVATDQRLLCLNQERFARKQIEFAAGQITRMQQGNRLRGYQIVLESAQGRYRIRISRPDAFRFAGSLAPLMPSAPAQIHDAELEPRLALPGVGAMVGMVSRVTKGTPPELATRAHVARVESNVERLQMDVERLQQQVMFLEELLQKRAAEAYLPHVPADT